MSEKEVFIAGFMQSSEGYNGELGASEDDVAQLYEEWKCGHEWSEWVWNHESGHELTKGYKDNVFKIRECKDCGKVEREWRMNQ